ncbi:alpha/beta hydrolase, partial [Amycolatopsis sp. NPDC003676]
MKSPARPALDPELGALITDMPLIPEITSEILTQLRQIPATPLETLLADRQIHRREVLVPGTDGYDIPMTVLTPHTTTETPPCVYWMHGGGMIMGDRFAQLDIPLEWLDAIGAVVVTVDYRLAPEYGGIIPVRDCYDGLRWIADHADELGIDPHRIVT